MPQNNDDSAQILPGTHTPAAEPLPLSIDLRTVFLGGIFVMLLLSCMRFASVIFMPIVLAFVLKLVLQPFTRFLEKLHLPRIAAAGLLLFALMSVLIAFCTALSVPAADWIVKLPSSIPTLQHKLGFLSHPITEVQKFLLHAEDLTQGAGPEVVPVAVQGSRLSDKIFMGTRAFASSFFTTMLVLFFLLASGDTFLRRMVEILPRFQDKRQAVDLSQQIEQNLSVYLLTITCINLGVGVITAGIMWFCGINDPILWGTLAFLLNYIPILGAMIAALIFVMAGLLVSQTLVAALIPAGLYLLLHFMEGTVITPMLIAKRFTLNPVLVVLALIFWYWMWGFAGAVLAMPMLAITKIICDRIQGLNAFGHFLEG